MCLGDLQQMCLAGPLSMLSLYVRAIMDSLVHHAYSLYVSVLVYNMVCKPKRG